MKKPTKRMKFVDCESGLTVIKKVERADTLLTRTIGLMGAPELPADEGVWLVPCKGVHTFFMRFSIDVLFLNHDGVVIALQHSLPPWRISGFKLGASTVLELKAGEIKHAGIEVGKQYRFTPVS